MNTVKPIAAVLAGLALSFGSVGLLAKGHDQGVADGTPRDDTGEFSRNGFVAGVDASGIAPAASTMPR